jgi:methyltransferase (TIGR00027 family)
VKNDRPSATAEGTAGVRAIESLRPENERVCYDPLAMQFLGTKYRILAKVPLLAKCVLWLIAERHVPGLTGEAVVRTRYIDDCVEECTTDGTQQLVILGAGYDSRAYRIGGLKGKLRVFEVDHPPTQKAKIRVLKRLLGSLPEYVVYVAIDFDKEKLDRKLSEHGYDRNVKTLFIWEGVTMYLTAEAVDETLAFVVNNSGPGSSIVFNYIYRSVADGTCESKAAKNHCRIVAKRGEPFVFGIEEGKIEEFLRSRGFPKVNNASPEFLHERYFKGPNQHRKVLPYLPLVHATVNPTA